MNISRVILKIQRLLYKRQLEQYIGKSSKSLKVTGKVFFENGSLSIGKNVIIYPGVMFSGNGHVSIGDNVKIGKDTIIYANKNGGVTIGNNTIIAAQCYIIDSNHGSSADELISTQLLESKHIEIGNDVWIGANATIIMGAKILDGAIIGAKSLVNSTIDRNAIAFGCPAKTKKYRI